MAGHVGTHILENGRNKCANEYNLESLDSSFSRLFVAPPQSESLEIIQLLWYCDYPLIDDESVVTYK